MFLLCKNVPWRFGCWLFQKLLIASTGNKIEVTPTNILGLQNLRQTSQSCQAGCQAIASIYVEHDQKHKKYKKLAVPLHQTITSSTYWGTMTQTRTYYTFVPFEPNTRICDTFYAFFACNFRIYAYLIRRYVQSALCLTMLSRAKRYKQERYLEL